VGNVEIRLTNEFARLQLLGKSVSWQKWETGISPVGKWKILSDHHGTSDNVLKICAINWRTNLLFIYSMPNGKESSLR
jgi:hypothetical protein